MYVPEFAADPHAAYRRMRARYGSLVPVELDPGVPATLVVGYRTALRILNDPEHFPADPRIWQQSVPDECPVKPMLMYRRNALRTAGEEHARLRRAYSVLGDVDENRLLAAVDGAVEPLINRFRAQGCVDLRAEYVFPAVFGVLSDLMGLPADLASRTYDGMAKIMDGVDAAAGEREFGAALFEAVQLKQAHPGGSDLMSRLMAHSADLTVEEVVMQVALPFAAGCEPTVNLVCNALRLLMSDERFAGDVLGGSLTTRDALDEVLFTDPPLPNFGITYPRQPILVDGVWLPAHQPVVISYAACNNDPEIAGGDRAGNRSHLAYGAGVHRCPATSMVLVIAIHIIDQLLDAFPDLRLGVAPEELRYRTGIFHRALAALPAAFDPVHQDMELAMTSLLAPRTRPDRKTPPWQPTD
nr:cytochrome P450 [Nocardia transvalensis]